MNPVHEPKMNEDSELLLGDDLFTLEENVTQVVQVITVWLHYRLVRQHFVIEEAPI